MSKTCPKCQKVYDDDSLTVCPDCNEELTVVEAVKEIKQVSVFSLTSEESAQGVIEYMKEQGVEGTYQYSLREKTYKIYVAQPDARAALRACTSYYAVEAKRLKAEEDKRRAEEEARRQAEEEARRKAEEEERLRREAEEARIRAEEEARRQAEEEARRQAEEEERRRIEAEEEAKRQAEEAERLQREAEEAEKRRIAEEEERKRLEAEEAVRRAEEEAKRQAEEAERLQHEAEEAEKRRIAEAEERKRLEAEAEQRRIAEEAARKKAEEDEARRLASERRRKSFEESIRKAEEAEKQREESRRILDSIPHITGETVQDETPDTTVDDLYQPESGPIFVETEPVDEYAVGDTIIVDAVEVNTNDESDNFYSSISNTEKQEANYDNFFSGIKKRGVSDSPLFDSKKDNTDEGSKNYSSDDSFFANLNKDSAKSDKNVVEDMFSNNLFNEAKAPADRQGESVSGSTFEEIINNNVHKTEPSIEKHEKKNSFAASFAKLDSLDQVDDGNYKGFIPDYHEDTSEDEDEILARKYGFDSKDYKELKERTAKKLHDRKANPPARPKPENKDFVLLEEDDIDSFKGFIPDYSAQAKEEEKMSYYTKRTSIDYSKYRTPSSASAERNSLADLNGTLRSSTQTELSRLFESGILKNASKPGDFSDIKSSNYLLALTGGQLNSLFTSWLMTNVTSVSVKQFEKSTASADENYKNKIEGVKNLLKQNFGKLDDSIIDIIVRKFYNKYLDE